VRSSVLTDSGKPLYNTNEPWNPKLLNGKKKGYSGTDPGITDVATVAHFKVVDGRISLRKHHPTALTVL
jgi:hypothetical protein